MPHQVGYWVKQIYMGLNSKRTTNGREAYIDQLGYPVKRGALICGSSP